MSRADPEFPPGAALVLGGAGGVGAAVARALVAAGSGVALTYRSSAEAARALAAELGQTLAERYRAAPTPGGKSGGEGGSTPAGGSSPEAASSGAPRASAHPLDLAGLTPEVAGALVEAVLAEHGALHTVVLAAGADLAMLHVGQVGAETLRRVVDIELHGAFAVMSAALPALRRTGGSLVHVSSAGLLRWPPGDALSVVPKAAVHALVRGVAREEGRHGVRANAVALGVIDGGMFHRLAASGAAGTGGLSPEWVEAARRNTPLRRFGTLTEVADVVVFLASRRASYVTGQLVALDGGYSV